MPRQSTASPAAFVQEIAHVYTPSDGLPTGPVKHVTTDGPGVLADTPSGAYALVGSRWHRTGGLYTLDEERPRPVPDEVARRGLGLQQGVRCWARDGAGSVWVGTESGIEVWSVGAGEVLTDELCPPVLDVQCLTLGPDGSVWIGTPRGAACLRAGHWHYYAGRRWLPDDRVNEIAVAGDGSAWVATDGGVAHIERRETTLAGKAAHFEAVTAARHDRRGFITECELRRPGDLSSFRPVASDNDGLWTALYVAAESFRYAVTGSEEAQALARRSMEALLRLLEVTGMPGFPARAVAWRGEDCGGYDPGDPNWQYQSAIDPAEVWKDDTSSDEVDGHYLAWYVYAELVASEAEKERIRSACRALTDHIIDHGFYLVGPEGHPTRWGVWAPERLNDDPEWREEHGLNSLEVLMYLRVAMHLCGDARYAEAYRVLIEEHHYALNTVRQKVLPPEGSDNHSDDELAWCAYYPLLMLEQAPALRRLYLASLERTWRILRPQGSPLHGFLYGAVTGRPCDVDTCVAWLQDAPWDLVRWTMRNSHRADVLPAPALGRFGHERIRSALPPSERAVERWNSDPYIPDAGSDGRSELDAAHWLLPYWLGRYHRLIGG